MKKIICDGCGNVISRYPIKMQPEYIDDVNGRTVHENVEEIPGREIGEMDFCGQCIDRIHRFVKNGSKNMPVLYPVKEEGLMLRYTVPIPTKKYIPVGLSMESNK